MKRYDLRPLKDNFYDRMIELIENDLKPQDYLEQILNSLKLSNLDNAYNTKINIILHSSVKNEINLFDVKSLH